MKHISVLLKESVDALHLKEMARLDVADTAKRYYIGFPMDIYMHLIVIKAQ